MLGVTQQVFEASLKHSGLVMCGHVGGSEGRGEEQDRAGVDYHVDCWRKLWTVESGIRFSSHVCFGP